MTNKNCHKNEAQLRFYDQFLFVINPMPKPTFCTLIQLRDRSGHGFAPLLTVSS